MRLSFYGAAGEVTGSCYLVETDRARVLIDFGLHQGDQNAERRNRRLPPIDPARLDAVILTHAHLDHSGRLPLLTPGHNSTAPSGVPLLDAQRRSGDGPSSARLRGGAPRAVAPRAARRDAGDEFRGPIYATPATIELTGILLRDAAHIQENDAERENRYRVRERKPPVTPLYTADDAERVLRLLRALPYNQPREVAPGITCRFTEAGHILGSASVELTVRERERQIVIAFSGDVGPRGSPLLRDPEPVANADVVILESTYGDRDHRDYDESIQEFARVLDGARAAAASKVLIPSFAVGRTQMLIYEIGRMRVNGGGSRGAPASSLPGVYVDSPMAIEATDLYRRHLDLFDEETRAIIASGDTPLAFPGLRFTHTREQSAALNTLGGGAVVIAASGMCTGGRILHHLRHGLGRPETCVVFVGFQARGTLGRRLVDGEPIVRVLGEPIEVKASIHTICGFSAHTGQSGLIEWAAAVKPVSNGSREIGGTKTQSKQRVFLTHGEDKPRAALRDRLRRELGWEPALPNWGESVEL